MAHQQLGFLLYRVKRQQQEAMKPSRTAVRLDPRNPFAQSEPRLAQLPDYFDLLSRNYASQGLCGEGLKTSDRAYRLAAAAGRGQQAAKLQQRAAECRRLGAKPQRSKKE